MPLGVLALDLERTLISDAADGAPRPGLHSFLTFCQQHFPRVVLFTCVEQPDAWSVLTELTRTGHVPAGFLDRLEYIAWTGMHKDLRFIPNVCPEDVLLVDDDSGWVRPEQRDQWVPIAGWDGGPDTELQRIQTLLAPFGVREE